MISIISCNMRFFCFKDLGQSIIHMHRALKTEQYILFKHNTQYAFCPEKAVAPIFAFILRKISLYTSSHWPIHHLSSTVKVRYVRSPYIYNFQSYKFNESKFCKTKNEN